MIDIKDGNAIIPLDLLAAFTARIKERERGLVEIAVRRALGIDGTLADVGRLNEAVKFPPLPKAAAAGCHEGKCKAGSPAAQ
jgi:hypothetical protein